jgi:filamentous hemagglutinin family protein
MHFMRSFTLAGLFLFGSAAVAQVATDGSVGARVTLIGPQFGIPDSFGARVGRNLLHSFSAFNVRAGESATFTGNSPTDNVIARITGGASSTIDGLVRVELAGANLFLVNPSGLVFGPGAAIDVPGAFHASTAHALKLADGTVVDMRSASPVTLTAAPPSAFGFEAAGAAVSLAGTQLRAREGGTIAIVAGDISLSSSAGRASVLAAPSGSLGLVATRGAGTVALDGARLLPAGFAAMGDVTIEGNSRLTASEGPSRGGGGTVFVRGGNVRLGHATIDANTRNGAAQWIDIGARGQLAVEASNVVTVTTGAGNAGTLRLEGRDVSVSGGSLVDTSCDPGCTTGQGGELTLVAGNGISISGSDPMRPTFVVSNSFGGGDTGPIAITAGGALTLSGVAYIQGISGLPNPRLPPGERVPTSGSGSTITLRTGSIDISGGAQVDASTRGLGNGGVINVVNAGEIRIAGTRLDPLQDGAKLPSGLFVNTAGSGAGGSIVVSTTTLQVLEGGEISSTAQGGSTGAGGRVQVRASGLVRVSGTDADGKSSGIVANTFASGDAGEIDVAADRIEISADGRVQSQSQGSGRANAIRVQAREMALTGGGQVSSDARGEGDGGTVSVTVGGSLRIEGTGATGNSSGIFAKTYGTARGGTIAVAAGDITIEEGGIFTQSDGAGAAGDLEVVAARTITLQDTNLAANGISASGRGVGSETSRAGNVSIRAGDSILILNSRPDFGAVGTSARSLQGGNIAIEAGRFMMVDGSDIAAEVLGGFGGGGNVTVTVPTLVLRGARVSANADGGPGGNIRISAQTIFQSADSSVTASSRLGIDGTVTYDSPSLDPTGELLAPAPVFMDAAGVLAGRCGPRLAGKASSLVVAPRGGEPAHPDELRPVVEGVAASFPLPAAELPPSCHELPPGGAASAWQPTR